MQEAFVIHVQKRKYQGKKGMWQQSQISQHFNLETPSRYPRGPRCLNPEDVLVTISRKEEKLSQMFLSMQPFVILQRKDLLNIAQIIEGQHHELYLELFTDSNLKSEHFMVHYLRMVCAYGLIHLWCMRFEAKLMFCVKECRTIEFNSHYHAYEFEIPNNTNLCLLCLSNCADFNSYKMNVMIDLRNFNWQYVVINKS
ncbi:hypothetical protein Avbf_08338 [Armadillidium vulgare]|nr:hypothetical protein Avbf_08338 [Armadillidium vulgare]